MTTEQRAAFTFFAASFGEMPSEAQFMLLMIAIEGLIDQKLRQSDALNLIESFSEQTRQSGLDQATRNSILGQLGRMREQSISEAGRELMAELGDKQYAGLPADKFFTRCYTVRSRLVHFAAPGPTRQEVGALVHPLRQMVGDLIAGPELVAVVDRARMELTQRRDQAASTS